MRKILTLPAVVALFLAVGAVVLVAARIFQEHRCREHRLCRAGGHRRPGERSGDRRLQWDGSSLATAGPW